MKSASKKTDGTAEAKASEEEAKAEAPKSAPADTGDEGALKFGDVLPSITLLDNKENKVDVSKLADKEHGVVLFLYPRVSWVMIHLPCSSD